MLRVHFTSDDLARIRVRADPHPLWEVLLSLHMMQTRQATVAFGAWRRSALSTLATLGPAGKILTTLAPAKGYSPDFLTPPVDGADLETGLDAVLSTSRRHLRADLGRLTAQGTESPAWVGSMAEGEVGIMRLLGDSIRRYHAEVLQPHWPVMRAHVRADRAHRADMALGHGLEHVLNTLHSTIRWRAPILEVAYPVDQDLHLEGRGLVLAPSFFCWQTPITLADPARQPMLLYPIDHHLDWSTVPTDLGDTPGPQSLVALLGRTRATVLQAIADSTQVNTTELARTTGVSLASASQHATVLRDAGLVVTLRRNGAAVHRLSVRGANLIDPATALSRL